MPQVRLPKKETAILGATENDAEPLGTSSWLREMAVVSAIVVAITCILWWRFLPLPHQDLNYYTEPAYLLAKFGKLAGPGSQYVDLTYQKGIYSYPPGYFIILAGWLKVFGLSPDSLLAYTHLVHVGAMILLWMILRKRYSCSRLISVLVLLAFFPRMAHGRPDLTATFLSLAAWEVLPEELNWPRIVFSACIAGATLSVSPGFGVSIIATLLILLLLNPRLPFPSRLRSSVGWLTAVGLFFGVTTAIVLTWQNSWTIAYVQFKTNVAIRGAQVNALPEMHSLFAWAFSIVPFSLVAVVPAILAVTAQRRNVMSYVRNVGLAFLGGIAVWFLNNKSQLLLDHHFLCPSKSVFLGVMYSWLRLPTWMRATPLLLLSLIGFYYHKADYLYLASPLRQEEQKNAAEVKPNGVAAVDSFYFARFYRPAQTLNYEVAEVETYWRQYREAIPGFARNEMLSGLAEKPMEPSMLLVSAFSALTVSRFREKEQFNLPCKQAEFFPEKLHILGRTWNLPAHPYALKVCSE